MHALYVYDDLCISPPHTVRMNRNAITIVNRDFSTALTLKLTTLSITIVTQYTYKSF